MSSAALSPGTELCGLSDRYTLESSLGRGGFGETYAARRESDAAEVVLKVLRVDRLDDLKAMELFEREARALASLDHPGVPRTFEHFVWDGERAHPLDAGLHPGGDADTPERPAARWVMVQSRAPGRSLAEHIAAGQRLDAATLEALLRALLELLDYLHGLHPPLVHRDIKPANVMLATGPSGPQVTLVDFGAIQSSARAADSVASTSVGTFGFIPMEQMMGQARPASDLFAAAMTLVVTASHRYPEDLPFDENSGKVDLDALGLPLSPGLRRALSAMLEPIVGKRSPSARAALELLHAPAPQTLPAALPRPQAPALPAQPRHPWLWNGAMGLGGLGAGSIYLVFFDSLSETALIQLSALWLAPLAFGVIGRLADRAGKPHPIASAFLGAGACVVALIFFIYAIFPAL
ncbi:serine/threonine protein kinase [Pseudenhygromyxa sp. WMMC2535]|uniref:serine/threonine protein kinase n=1 Tax=Pseudenhygromyxa sp. WMMC2535 TaxID=2712867 RepID=UPI0015552792|nr:serine/threonine-protein kinase [Pseudenhygromyxa sp. WMMC2535]NVB37810.1 serine/threonine protein kinase [Pseudenhygromyxa sp. WMMC2535]